MFPLFEIRNYLSPLLDEIAPFSEETDKKANLSIINF